MQDRDNLMYGETEGDIDAILREYGYNDDIEIVELDEVWDDA